VYGHDVSYLVFLS